MIKENRVSKYILYAIGETILVVIGILIALQINNWNEEKKTKAKIKNTLVALHNDLVQDTLLITNGLPYVIEQFELNESLRDRVAQPKATLDTLINITRYEFNPNWSYQILYNTNAYNSLNQTGLIESLSDSLKANIKNFYNNKFYLNNKVEKITNDYRNKVSSFVDTYAFGSTSLHDQGPLINNLIWENVNPSHLAATFQGISNFKRIQYKETKEEMEYSLTHSRSLLQHIDSYLKKL
ncbi:MAG: hypothetical protein DA407_05475 [Bacteroidetes bacterium]|nr:MAG: hypothetical protein DA407_05475 [Bacteroidota bacterium]